jgi:diaminopimelate decarboxylase
VGFHRVDGELFCEGRAVRELADRHGTPLYAYSRSTMVERYGELRSAFGEEAQICYAVKSNSNLHLLRLFGELGAGFDLVSGGELRRLEAVGLGNAPAVFAGVGKQKWEIEAALEANVLFFSMESAHEVSLLGDAGSRRGVVVPLALRLNPDIDPETHAYITTGRQGNKFGVDLETASGLVEEIARNPNLALVGYHVHLGSQIRGLGPYLRALDRVEEFLDGDALRREGLRYYDMGGGFAISPEAGTDRMDVAALAAAVMPRLGARGLRAVVEPGRYLVGEAGILVSRVLGAKASGDRHFLIVDGAMNDLLRPALYGAVHPVAPVGAAGAGSRRWDVVGPVCESSDFLALDRVLPDLHAGDLLAVFATGAYGASMGSNYNTRRRPAEVLVSGNHVETIRRRETFEELWAQEMDP